MLTDADRTYINQILDSDVMTAHFIVTELYELRRDCAALTALVERILQMPVITTDQVNQITTAYQSAETEIGMIYTTISGDVSNYVSNAGGAFDPTDILAAIASNVTNAQALQTSVQNSLGVASAASSSAAPASEGAAG